MNILVTGGEGFIGSNFVLDWIAQSDEAVVNLDLLTYAGNLENLSRLEVIQGTSLCMAIWDNPFVILLRIWKIPD